LSELMQWSMGKYTQWFNRRYQRSGTIWEGRYWAATVTSEAYFLRCACYIDLNPVRAGVVTDPGDYPWSSYRHYSTEVSDSLVSEHELYARLGSSPSTRSAAYVSLARSGIADEEVAYIRESTRTSRAIGV